MKKRIIRIICLGLCAVLLLGGCSKKETHSLPDAYDVLPVMPKLSDFVRASVELYLLHNPDAYVYWTGGGPSGFGLIGADAEAYVNSEYALEGVNYDYNAAAFDPRPTHDIPREPVSEVSFEDGVTIRMERSVYPCFPREINYIMESDSEISYGGGAQIHKYVDGEWRTIYSGYVVLALAYHLPADSPETFTLNYCTKWLGEGLYKVTQPAGYPKEDYWVEFAVSADAEPLELPAPETARGYDSNFFYQYPLPMNVKIEATNDVTWPLEACSYSVEHGGYDEARLAALLLGDGYTDKGGGVYTKGDKTLSFADGISLTSSAPELRKVTTALPYTASKYTPAEFQNAGVYKENYLKTTRKLLPDELAVLAELGTGEYSVRRYELRRHDVGNALRHMLEYYENTLTEAEFRQKYGDLDEIELQYEYDFYCIAPLVPDAAGSAITEGVYNDKISGAEIYAVCAGGELLALEYRNAPSSLTANDDSTEVVSPYKAAKAVLPKLFDIDEEISLVSAEFAYSYRDGDTDTLYPTWIFTVADERPSTFKEKITVENYIHFAVDARSGKLVN